MKWPWVRRSDYDEATRLYETERSARGAEYTQYLDSVATMREALDTARILAADLAAERALTRDLLAQLDLAQRPAAPDEVTLPDVVRSALDQRAPWRGNRKLRMALERDVRQMMRDDVQPEVVASMILDGERVE